MARTTAVTRKAKKAKTAIRESVDSPWRSTRSSPKALPWLEGLYMETDLIIEAFEWPAELAGSKSLRCAATRSIIYSVRALLRD